MLPTQLMPLQQDITTLSGIGRKMRPLFENLLGVRIIDLLFHKPVAVVDRRRMPSILAMRAGELITALVTVQQHIPPKSHGGKSSSARPFRVRCYNETGFLTLVFFHAHAQAIEKILPIGEKRVISGRVERFNNEVQIIHPDHINKPEDLKKISAVWPVYPLTQGLSPKLLHKTMQQGLQVLDGIFNWPEWIPLTRKSENNWPSFIDAIKHLHAPQSEEDLSPENPAIMRLAYDEFLALQIALQHMRKNMRNEAKQSANIPHENELASQFRAALPFQLTAGQQQVFADIRADFAAEIPMRRLLQGDVGSGKTVVAALAMMQIISAKKQSALMAPTEILASQHAQFLRKFAEPLGCRVALLHGGLSGRERTQIKADLANGEVEIVVGTHALFQESVSFSNLGLVIIDEQHRFGVQQRLRLVQKGVNTHVLAMSATPIPRSLAMTLYGDMECSILMEKPAFKQPITTRIIAWERMAEVIERLQNILDRKEQVYWICPLVEESEQIDLASAEERAKTLQDRYGERVSVVHGQMPALERDRVMNQFRAGTISILVSTTVVEVGVDVPQATAIIIEQAERFGLSQLHQLRGRVGRGASPSSCVLLYQKGGSRAAERLEILRQSEDGFRIAEEDLRLRGSGDILGTRQTGLPNFRFANLEFHEQLLSNAQTDAANLLQQPLSTEANLLLNLFDYKIAAAIGL
jgi:ATP-dependent DNA helicase RecG